MNIHATDIANLRSIRFRNTGYKRKSILKPEKEIALRRFLFDSINENVFVVSTGLGLDVYYISEKDYSNFIIRYLYLFHADDPHKNISIEEQHMGQEVLKYFNVVVHTLTSHPQLLYSCVKKILMQFKEMGINSKLDKILFQCLDNYIQYLDDEENVPFYHKIKKLRSEIDTPSNFTEATNASLIQTYLSAFHYN